MPFNAFFVRPLKIIIGSAFEPSAKQASNTVTLFLVLEEILIVGFAHPIDR
jgi:hypothetical protein